jgi:hypothetical protein
MTSLGPDRDSLVGLVSGVLRRLPGARKRSFVGLVEEAVAVEAVLATLEILLSDVLLLLDGWDNAARDGMSVIIRPSSFTRVKTPDRIAYMPSGSAASRSLNASASLATASRLLSSAVLSSTSWHDIPMALE